MVKNYMNIIKQLNDMLPEDKKINEDDEFERFNGSLWHISKTIINSCLKIQIGLAIKF